MGKLTVDPRLEHVKFTQVDQSNQETFPEKNIVNIITQKMSTYSTLFPVNKEMKICGNLDELT